MNERSCPALLSPIVTRDNQRKHSAELMVFIEHNGESPSFHICYDLPQLSQTAFIFSRSSLQISLFQSANLQNASLLLPFVSGHP